MVYNLAAGCSSHQELTSLLYELVKPKTALNLNQVCEVGTLKMALYIVNRVYFNEIYVLIFLFNSCTCQDKKELRV